jgi:O-antigen/teichoic acid export membrane protein
LNLKDEAISGVKWTTVSSVIVAVLQLVQLAILARFLEPSAFGLMAIVMVVIGFSQAFLDMGISNAIIYHQKITKDQLSTLYWVNILAGFILFVIISIVAPYIADFYEEVELSKLVRLVGLTFLIQPFGQQFMILWQKEMRFSEIAKIDIVNKSIALVVAVYFAYYGYGVYALVYGTLAGMVSQTIQFMYKGLQEYKPDFVFKIREIKEFLSFGAFQMGEKTINYFNRELDTLLIGKLLGSEALGIYTISKQLIMKPAEIINPIITKVAFPLMAKIQDDTLRLKNIYLKIIRYISSVNFPIYMLIFIFANDIVLILFGEAWLEAVDIVQVLSIFGALRSIGNPVGALLLAKGKVNWGFYWNLGLFIYIPLGIYISSYWGLVGISFGLVLMMLSLLTPNWYFLVRTLCKATFMEYHKQIFIPLIITIISGIVIYSINLVIDLWYLKVLLVSGIGGSVFVCLNYYFNRGFIEEIASFLKIKFFK